MTIEGRDRKVESVLEELRELFTSTEPLELDVLVSKKDDVLKVCTYAKMSGFKLGVSRSDNGYIVQITGTSCRCR